MHDTKCQKQAINGITKNLDVFKPFDVQKLYIHIFNVKNAFLWN